MIASIIAFVLWLIVTFLGFCVLNRFAPVTDNPEKGTAIDVVLSICITILIVFF